MNKRLQAYMEAETNTMIDDLVKETVDQAEEGKVIVIGAPARKGKSLTQLTTKRIQYNIEEGEENRHSVISQFLEDAFTKAIKWRIVRHEMRGETTFYEAKAENGFRFTYWYDYDNEQAVISYIPMDILYIGFGGKPPKEFLP